MAGGRGWKERAGRGRGALRGPRNSKDTFQLQEYKTASSKRTKTSTRSHSESRPHFITLVTDKSHPASPETTVSPGGGTVIIPIFQMRKQKFFSSVTLSHRDTQLGLDPYTPEDLTRRPHAQWGLWACFRDLSEFYNFFFSR